MGARGKWLKSLLFFVLALLLLFLAFRSVDFAHLRDGFREVRYGWVAVALLLGLMSHVVRAARWRLLIEPIHRRLPLGNVLAAVFVGYITNLAFPRLGEVAKCGSINKTDGTRFDSLLGTVVVERAFDLLATIFLTLLVLALQFERVGQFFVERIFAPICDKLTSISLLAYIVAIAIALLLVLLVVVVMRRQLLGERIGNKLNSLRQGLVDGLKSLFNTPKWGMFLIYTLLLWLAYWSMTWAVLRSTPITNGLGASDALFLLVVGSYGMVVPVQGGFGAFHVITAISLGIYGISYDDGLIFAIISHESQTLLLIVGGLVALAYIYLKISNKNKNERTRPVDQS